jgi:hypothetical protein
MWTHFNEETRPVEKMVTVFALSRNVRTTCCWLIRAFLKPNGCQWPPARDPCPRGKSEAGGVEKVPVALLNRCGDFRRHTADTQMIKQGNYRETIYRFVIAKK